MKLSMIMTASRFRWSTTATSYARASTLVLRTFVLVRSISAAIVDRSNLCIAKRTQEDEKKSHHAAVAADLSLHLRRRGARGGRARRPRGGGRGRGGGHAG